MESAAASRGGASDAFSQVHRASGKVRRNALSDFIFVPSNGKIAMGLDEGDHLIGVGEVASLWRQDGEPLVFYRGAYWSLSRPEAAPPEVDVT